MAGALDLDARSARQREPVMLFQTELGGHNQRVSNGEQPGFPITMPAPIDENAFQSEG